MTILFPLKKKFLSISCILVFVVITLNAFGQNNNMYAYKPKEDAVKAFVKALKAKTPEKQAELLLESISIDSNFSFPYHVLGDLKVQERLVFEDKGAFYYYSKFIDKQTKFSCEMKYGDNIWEQIKVIEYPNPMAEYYQDCYDVRSGSKTALKITCIEFVQKKRMDAVSYALVWNDNIITTSNEKMISTVVKDVQMNAKSEKCATLNNESAERVCLVLGDYYLQYSRYQDALQPYQIFDEYNNTFKYASVKPFKKETIESLQNRIALAYALNGQKELANQKLKATFKSLEPSKNTLKEAVKVMNVLEKIQAGETCKNAKGELVYCDNKNIRLDNLSSAFQMILLFKEFDYYSLRSLDKEIYKDSYNPPSSKDVLNSGNIEKMIKLVGLGSDLGMIWPKSRKISINELDKNGERNLIPYYLHDFFFKCNCIEGIIDIRPTANSYEVYIPSKKQASLTLVLSVPLDWRQFNNMPVRYYNPNGELVLKDSLGNNFPTTVTCSRAYEVYKANYEAELARQEAERIEQERIRQAQEQARIQQANETKLQLAIAEAEAKKATIQQEQKATQAQTKQAVEQGKVVNPFAFLDVFSSMFAPSSSSTPKKQVQCPVCKGGGSQTCEKCRGKGSYIHELCRGSGRYFDKQCNDCNGRGTLNCSDCKATGISFCRKCYGDGLVDE
jgi:hypothetical protein